MQDSAPNLNLEVYKQVINNPKVPMTLRVGIVGHRNLTDNELSRCLTVLHRIFESCSEILTRFVTPAAKQENDENNRHYEIAHTLYDLVNHPKPTIRLTSSLAIGVDRLGMHHSFSEKYHEALNIEHAAILPFSKNTYLKDFSESISQLDDTKTEQKEFEHIIAHIAAQPVNRLIELDGDYNDEHTRDQAYYQCAQVLVENCDLIIAFYDETHTEPNIFGHKAGTKSSIELAVSARKPVIQIDPTGVKSTTVLHSKRFGRNAVHEQLTNKSMQTLLSRVVLFAGIFKLEELKENPSKGLADRYSAILKNTSNYFEEKEQLTFVDTQPDYDYQGPIQSPFSLLDKLRGFTAFNLFKTVFSSKTRIAEIKAILPATEQGKYQKAAPLSSPSTNAFYSHFLVADTLAVKHATIHRSTYLLIYLLAAIALISTATGALFKDYLILLILMVGIKVFALATIYLLYIKDKHNHHKWLQSRCLAEAIRPNIYLNKFGRCFSFFDKRSSEEFMHRELLGHTYGGSQWVCMHSEAINRYIGFEHCQMADTNHKKNTINFLEDKWLNGQVNYHKSNAAQMKQLGERLSHWTHWLFNLTVIFVVLKIVFLVTFPEGRVPYDSHWYQPSKYTTLATLFFPIVGTALFATRNHAEFDISAQRSLTMLAFFISMKDYFKQISMQGDPINSSVADTSQIVNGIKKLTDVSAREVADWLEIYEVKESEPG